MPEHLSEKLINIIRVVIDLIIRIIGWTFASLVLIFVVVAVLGVLGYTLWAGFTGQGWAAAVVLWGAALGTSAVFYTLTRD